MSNRKRKLRRSVHVTPLSYHIQQEETEEGGESEADDDVEAEVVNEGAERSASIVSGRVVHKTKLKYANVFKNISEYCKRYRGATINNELKIPMKLEHMKAFFGDRFKEKADGSVQAFSHVMAHCSALKYFYKEKKVRMPEDQIDFLSEYCSGFKRLIADKKANGIMKNFEGKVPVAYLIYVRLAKRSLFAAENRTPYASYVHCFMLLSWNLFARSCSVAELRTNHLSWQNDSLVIDMSKQKSDQAGERIVPKHVYANPYCPEICPILGLALHMFGISFRFVNENQSTLFSGASYSLFSKWLQTALETVEHLGNEAKDYGTHSFRKGIATFCSGFIGGPSVIAIFLRAGWSLGAVQDRYITYSDGGDQFCGRVAAGLNLNGGSKFAVLPPHFNSSNILSDEEWQIICPYYRSYCIGFQSCIPYLLASLVFHHDWWTAKDGNNEYINISKDHPIHNSRVVSSGLILRLRQRLLPLDTTGRCTTTGMTATGIPPHVDMQREIEELRMENAKLREQMQSQHNDIMKELPIRVTENVLANCNIEGVQMISRNDFESAFDRLYNRLQSNITDNIRQVQSSSQNNSTLHNTIVYDTWDWGGKMCLPVPEGWSFPKGTTKSVCDLFLTGTPWTDNKRIRPFQYIRASLLARKDQSPFTKAEKVFNIIKRVALENNFYRGTLAELKSISIPDWDRVFLETYTHLMGLVSAKRGKVIAKAGELSFITFYDMLNELSN